MENLTIFVLISVTLIDLRFHFFFYLTECFYIKLGTLNIKSFTERPGPRLRKLPEGLPGSTENVGDSLTASRNSAVFNFGGWITLSNPKSS